MNISFAIFMELFVSIHMSIFVLLPLAKMISNENYKTIFSILFGIRAGILLFFDFFITPAIAIYDFIFVFIGAFILVPIIAKAKGVTINPKNNQVLSNTLNTNNLSDPNNTLNTTNNLTYSSIELKCVNCGETLQIDDKFCTKCGARVDKNNIQFVKNIQDNSPIVPFDSTYNASATYILKNMIIDEFKNQGEDINLFTTSKIYKNKTILLLIFAILSFITCILYYLNYSTSICFSIEIILFIIYLFINKKFNIINNLNNQAINNPDADITLLVKNTISEKKEILIPNFLRVIIAIFMAGFIPTIMFFNPKIIYTKYGDGYQVFKYARSIVKEDEVTIPETYKGKNVIAIGEGAFKNSQITKITLPNTIESIKIDAFRNARNIQSIVLPESLIEIRANAFADMTSLTYIYLPNGLRDIRGGVFANDINLTNVILPNSLEYLGASAFSHCSSITSITIPKGVTEINGQTFEYMTSLKTIYLHDDITYIHGEVFVGDINLDNVILPSKITEIKGSTFENCTSLTSIKIPDGVTRIGGHAFYGCSSLSEVYIPTSVIEIGSSAFRQCTSLKNITIPRTALVSERAFKESPTIISYYS